MPIQHAATEQVWERVYKPVIDNAGFEPRRVDKDDDGSMVMSQIIQFISLSPLLVADLTIERPNCYLEVGYAMGLNKHTNLILCCREDHYHGSPRHVVGGPKVHFDVSSFNIIWWSGDDLDKFRADLSAKIEQRKKLVTKPEEVESERSRKAVSGFQQDLEQAREEALSAWKRKI